MMRANALLKASLVFLGMNFSYCPSLSEVATVFEVTPMGANGNTITVVAL